MGGRVAGLNAGWKQGRPEGKTRHARARARPAAATAPGAPVAHPPSPPCAPPNPRPLTHLLWAVVVLLCRLYVLHNTLVLRLAHAARARAGVAAGAGAAGPGAAGRLVCGGGAAGARQTATLPRRAAPWCIRKAACVARGGTALGVYRAACEMGGRPRTWGRIAAGAGGVWRVLGAAGRHDGGLLCKAHALAGPRVLLHWTLVGAFQGSKRRSWLRARTWRRGLVSRLGAPRVVMAQAGAGVTSCASKAVHLQLCRGRGAQRAALLQPGARPNRCTAPSKARAPAQRAVAPAAVPGRLAGICTAPRAAMLLNLHLKPALQAGGLKQRLARSRSGDELLGGVCVDTYQWCNISAMMQLPGTTVTCHAPNDVAVAGRASLVTARARATWLPRCTGRRRKAALAHADHEGLGVGHTCVPLTNVMAPLRAPAGPRQSAHGQTPCPCRTRAASLPAPSEPLRATGRPAPPAVQLGALQQRPAAARRRRQIGARPGARRAAARGRRAGGARRAPARPSAGFRIAGFRPVAAGAVWPRARSRLEIGAGLV